MFILNQNSTNVIPACLVGWEMTIRAGPPGVNNTVLDAGPTVGAELAESVADQLTAEPTISAETRQNLLRRIAERQSAVAYPEDIATWLESVGGPC